LPEPAADATEKRLHRARSAQTLAKYHHAIANEGKLAERLDGWNLPDSEAPDVLVVIQGGEFVTDPGQIRAILQERKRRIDARQSLPDDEEVHAFEVKTFLTQEAGQIHMGRLSRERKEAFTGAYGADFHTVLFDDRDRFGRGRYAGFHSGHRLLYRRGVGSFRWHDMEPVDGFDELLDLALMPAAHLPEKARQRDPRQEWLERTKSRRTRS
jgi:hypothetical protein